MIGEIFYILFVWPIRFILEFFFVLFNRIFDAPGLAVVFLSVVVNTLSLPIYLIADRWQKEERDLQKRMKNKVDRIKANFKGDERQMILNTYYRQMGYSQVFLLKASVGLLLQIPFFIAAYQLLSGTSLLKGASFLFLKNLDQNDALLPLGIPFLGIAAINIMPVIMTAFNLLSSVVYSRNLGKRETVQLFAMAFVFLVLLYRSPSGLVLYWTINNLYSFLKNTAQARLKKPGRVLQIAALFFAFVFIYLIWSGKASVERYQMLFTGIAVFLAIVPFIWHPFVELFYKRKEETPMDKKSQNKTNALFFSGLALLFLLLGFLNPLQVLSASVSDFENPWSFFGRTVLQGFSFFVLLPLFIRSLSPFHVRRILALMWSVLVLSCLICYFALAAYYGVIDRNFKVEDTGRLLHAFPLWVSLAVPLLAAVCIALFVKLKKEKTLTVLFQAAFAAILLLAYIDFVTLKKGYAELSALQKNDDHFTSELPVFFPLSKTKANVFIVFLDRAQGSAMADALKYMPSLKEEMEGFIFFPNTLSFGSCTVTGVPAMLGGYDYTPQAINDRREEFLVDKVNSAITAMPRLFGEAGYRVTVTDPVIANMQSVPDVSVFRGLPNVNARLLSGKLVDRYRTEFPGISEEGINAFDFDILFRYGIFRASPPALRYGIHYKGQWWREAAYNSYGRAVAEFSSLYYLPEICFADNGEPTFNIFMSAVVHEGGAYNSDYFLQEAPLVLTEEEILAFGSKENAEYIYTLLSALKQLVKWIHYLKREGVYGNTRIIVVSDHGGYYLSRPDNANMEAFNPLFMIKDFNNKGSLVVSDEFMTHADTPYLAFMDLAFVPPEYTALEEKKYGKMTAVAAVSSQPLRHGPYQFNLFAKRELKGREVFRKESWGDWEFY